MNKVAFFCQLPYFLNVERLQMKVQQLEQLDVLVGAVASAFSFGLSFRILQVGACELPMSFLSCGKSNCSSMTEYIS